MLSVMDYHLEGYHFVSLMVEMLCAVTFIYMTLSFFVSVKRFYEC